MSAADIATVGEYQPQSFEVCILCIGETGSARESTIREFFW
jgi:hypothetical protein